MINKNIRKKKKQRLDEYYLKGYNDGNNFHVKEPSKEIAAKCTEEELTSYNLGYKQGAKALCDKLVRILG